MYQSLDIRPMPDQADQSPLTRKLDECRAGFQLETVPFADAADWGIDDGALQHTSRGFFSVSGVDIGGDRMVLLYQPQAAVTGIVSAMKDGERRFLLQGRAEPGCIGDAQFGPTIQSTPANYMRAHGGSTTPYVEQFIQHDSGISVLEDTTQLDLGGRYLFKTKRSILLEAAEILDELPAFIWADQASLIDALAQSAFMNIDLRSLIAISRWSPDGAGGELTPRAPDIARSLAAPVRAAVMGQVLAAIAANPPRGGKFVPVAEVPNWSLRDNGLFEDSPRQGFGVEFYRVSAAFREVSSWVQPLVNSTSQGEALLACRERNGLLEFFVQTLPEPGLATGCALAPSHLRYPGTGTARPDWLAPFADAAWSETVESDEGGRFFQDGSRYAIVRCDDARHEPDPATGVWMRVSEIKAFLATSNICTIQLRGLMSQLLALT